MIVINFTIVSFHVFPESRLQQYHGLSFFVDRFYDGQSLFSQKSFI